MSREAHVRFWESAGVRFPRATRLYSNSLTTGDWEGYVSSDLVAYIDSHYRTIPRL